MSGGKRRAARAFLVAALLGASAAWAQDTARAPASQLPARSLDPPPGAIVAAGNPPDLIFLYTGDVIGYIEPCG